MKREKRGTILLTKTEGLFHVVPIKFSGPIT